MTMTTTAATNTTNNHIQIDTLSHAYCCISCLQPTQRLYKQYSTKHNIRLEQCTKCSKDVDKYIEYELLLKLMDVVLFRKLAYRHLLFNNNTRNFNADGSADDGIPNANDKNDDCFHNSNAFLYFLLIISLRTISIVLLIQGISVIPERATPQENFLDNNDRAFKLEPLGSFSPFLFGGISLISMMEYLVLYGGTLLSTKFLNYCIDSHLHQQETSSSSISSSDKSSKIIIPNSTPVWRELCLAIFLPPLFQFVTLFVHIFSYEYEEEQQQQSQNTFMSPTTVVQLLGSSFIFGFTYMAVHCVVERRLHNLVLNDWTTHVIGTTNKQQWRCKNSIDRFITLFSKMIPGWPFIFGLVLKIIILPHFLSLFRMVLVIHDKGNTNDTGINIVGHHWEDQLLLLQYNLSSMMMNHYHYSKESISGFMYQLLINN